MATAPSGMRRVSTRAVRKVEVPRPLKSSPSETKNKISTYNIETVDKLITLMDMVVEAITRYQNEYTKNANEDESALLTSNIAHLCKHLKCFGPQLEDSIYQGQLDHACLVFRDAVVHRCLDYSARTYLLEIIELRENGWVPPTVPLSKGLTNPNFELDNFIDTNDLKNSQKHLTSTSESAIPLKTDEVLRRVMKHRDKASKNQSYKDEIIIRNSDSGKVMGIKGRRVHMIEQLSDTVISFQRVSPNAKERQVQISGPQVENVSYATRLIENTIRSNSSPLGGLSESESNTNSDESSPDYMMGDNDLGAFGKNLKKYHKKEKSCSNSNIQPFLYRHKVSVSNCQLIITGDDYNYVTVAKAVLDDFFSKLRQNDASYEENCDNVLGSDEINGMQESLALFKTSEKPLLRSYPSGDFSGASFLQTDLSSGSDNYMQGKTRVDSQEYFKSSSYGTKNDSIPDYTLKDQTTFPKKFLLESRYNKLSQEKPKDWLEIVANFPEIAKEYWDEDVIDLTESTPDSTLTEN